MEPVTTTKFIEELASILTYAAKRLRALAHGQLEGDIGTDAKIAPEKKDGKKKGQVHWTSEDDERLLSSGGDSDVIHAIAQKYNINVSQCRSHLHYLKFKTKGKNEKKDETVDVLQHVESQPIRRETDDDDDEVSHTKEPEEHDHDHEKKKKKKKKKKKRDRDSDDGGVSPKKKHRHE